MGGCSQVKMIMETHSCLQLAVYTGLFPLVFPFCAIPGTEHKALSPLPGQRAWSPTRLLCIFINILCFWGPVKYTHLPHGFFSAKPCYCIVWQKNRRKATNSPEWTSVLMLKELPARNTERIVLCYELTFAVGKRTVLKDVFCTKLVQLSSLELSPPAGWTPLFTASMLSQGSLVPGKKPYCSRETNTKQWLSKDEVYLWRRIKFIANRISACMVTVSKPVYLYSVIT